MPISPLIPIDKLHSWKDASDASTITSSSTRVSEWADKFNTSYNATQSLLINQPYTGTATINGRNAIEFDGAEFFDVADNSMLSVPQTVFMVMEFADAFSTNAILSKQPTDGTQDNEIIFEKDVTDNILLSANYYSGGEISGNIFYFFPLDLVPICFSIFADVGKYSQVASNNYNTYNEFTSGANTLIDFTNYDTDVSTYIGKSFFFPATTLYLSGKIGEILIFNGELSILEQGNVFKYLQNKWGIV